MRTINIKTLYQKVYKVFAFTKIWLEVFGTPEKGSTWLIYGNEKNGKTFFCLKLAEYLSQFDSVLYISAEEGLRLTFQESCLRANFDVNNSNVKFLEYTEISELFAKINKRQGPKIVVWDNMTIYNDDFKYGVFRKYLQDYPNVTNIFIAHEDKKEPYTSTAKLCKKLADIIIRIEGMTAFVSGRCPGGEIVINQEKAQLFYGSKTL